MTVPLILVQNIIILTFWKTLQITGYNYMLKNGKIEYNWIFQIIIRYDNSIFLISVGLVTCACVCVFVFELGTTEKWFFQRVHLSEAVARRCSVKKVFCKIHRKTPVPESLFFNNTREASWSPICIFIYPQFDFRLSTLEV